MPNVATWVGSGARGGHPYFHVGSFSGDASNPSTVRVGAFDICKDSSYICNHFDFGSLILTSTYINRNDDYLIRQWDEEWYVQ